jgi:hypothetical protein
MEVHERVNSAGKNTWAQVLGQEVKKDEMGGTYSTNGREEERI